MEITNIFDTYSLRARLFPAIIAIAPALAGLALLISWDSLELSNTVATIGSLVLLFAIADLARVRGRAVGRRLYSDFAGLPSVTMFRRSDPTIDKGSKERYLAFLASQLGESAPTPDEERANQKAADEFYEQCGVWLRQNTRDTKRFSLLFHENITYGFRRNLYGVKWPALCLNFLIVGTCIFLFWRASWNFGSDEGKRIGVVLLVSVAHATYMLLAVNRSAVWDAARAYGRELILSCEAFLVEPGSPNK